MIEVLVDYIQNKGFTVKVFSQRLAIYKTIGEIRCCIYWMISNIDLNQSRILFYEADEKMKEIDNAIAVRRAEQLD